MKRIIVACGSGIATSGLVANKITYMLEERGLLGKAYVDCIDVASLDTEIGSADIFVSIMPTLDVSDIKIPTLSGVPILTGVGADEVLDQLEALVR